MASHRLRRVALQVNPSSSPAILSAGSVSAQGACANGPLSGYRVLDLSQMLSGPMGCQILADQGADVVKIEPLEGDLVRAFARRSMTPTFCIINRNKRSIGVDLKKPEGLSVVLKLAKTADVVVQNFRPGAAEKLGIGYEDIKKVRPDIVYLSISGFGEAGPYAEKRVYDPIIQAVTGLPSIQADETGRPRMMRLIIPDKVTSLTAAQTVTAALLQRVRTGQGQHVKVSMLDAVMAFVWPEGMAAHTLIEGRASGDDQRHSFYQRDLIYDCKDGFVTVATNNLKEWRGLCAAFGKSEWLQDPRFKDGPGIVANKVARMDLVQQHLQTMTCAEALAVLDKHDVPCAPVHHPRSEVINDPQVKAAGTVMEAVHPVAGKMRFARPAAQFDSKFSIRHHAPLIGEQTEEILQELGIREEEIEQLRKAGVIREKPGVH